VESKENKLNNGIENFETLLKFCAANASSTGKNVKLSFQDSSNEFKVPLVLWNPSPFKYPEAYQKFNVLNDLINSVSDCINIKTDNKSIIWFPDGSSTKAEVTLTSKNSEDERNVTVKISEFNKIYKRFDIEGVK
jgi:hypothetical protein